MIIAFQGGPKVDQFDLTTVMTRRLTVTGSTMRPRTAAQKGAIAQSLLTKVWPKLEDGSVAPRHPRGVSAGGGPRRRTG